MHALNRRGARLGWQLRTLVPFNLGTARLPIGGDKRGDTEGVPNGGLRLRRLLFPSITPRGVSVMLLWLWLPLTPTARPLPLLALPVEWKTGLLLLEAAATSEVAGSGKGVELESGRNADAAAFLLDSPFWHRMGAFAVAFVAWEGKTVCFGVETPLPALSAGMATELFDAG